MRPELMLPTGLDAEAVVALQDRLLCEHVHRLAERSPHYQRLFRELGLHRVEAACLPSNEASQRLLRRVGFREEGLARAYLRIAGEWRDHLLFARLYDDRQPERGAASGAAV